MKILVVEDEPELARSIGDYLADENYLCEFATTYADALNKIEIYDYDCILLDLMLPGGNGLRLLNELKDQQKADGGTSQRLEHGLERERTFAGGGGVHALD